jgi:BirA family biotin operon repressor/biotin-[acetyl-CoA-carboxylase] ligase
VYDSLPSTSDELIARARMGAPEAAVLALRQTAGRGTRGRQWHDGAGNLMLSVLLRPDTPVKHAGYWSLLAGLATIEALSAFSADPARLQLKWPNDVLQDGIKLAGVLTESSAASGRLEWLVIGIGANLAQAPVLDDRRTAVLAEPIAPAIAAAAIVERLGLWRGRLADDGFEPARQAWLARAHPVGTALSVTLPSGRRNGRFVGISPAGGLLLACETETLTILTGEVG